MGSFLPAMLSVSYKLQQPVTGVSALKLILDMLDSGRKPVHGEMSAPHLPPVLFSVSLPSFAAAFCLV